VFSTITRAGFCWRKMMIFAHPQCMTVKKFCFYESKVIKFGLNRCSKWIIRVKINEVYIVDASRGLWKCECATCNMTQKMFSNEIYSSDIFIIIVLLYFYWIVNQIRFEFLDSFFSSSHPLCLHHHHIWASF
jgi:hypothetical protein